MFISYQEKKAINNRLSELTTIIDKLSSDIIVLSAKIKALESTKDIQPKKKKKPLTAAQKEKQRAYQKAYNERKKAQQLLTKETNVSS